MNIAPCKNFNIIVPVPDTLPPPNGSTIDAADVGNFSALAQQWWDVEGCFAALHRMNPERLAFIFDNIPNNCLRGKRVLDVGCGGGIASVAMARAGAMVTAVDASAESIKIAQAYSAQSLIPHIDYRCATVGDLTEQYDVITCLEVVEHVANLPLFLKQIPSRLAPSGTLFISTINRTPLAYLKAIVAAEYLLRWVPVGTHDWNKFIIPSELCALLPDLRLGNMDGLEVNPFSGKWHRSDDVNVNYIAAFHRC